MLLQVGMRNSVRTSELLQYRAEYSVPPRTERMIKAIEERDFQTFAELSMKDSNQFHAVCQDTFPPCVYMNQTSHSVSSLVHQLNEHFGEMVACYTYDAGPNACIFLLEKVALMYCTSCFNCAVQYVGLVAALLHHFYSDTPSTGQFLHGEKLELEPRPELLDKVTDQWNSPDRPAGLYQRLMCFLQLSLARAPGGLKYVLHTRPGEGPQQLTDPAAALLDKNGMPKNVQIKN